MVNSSYTNVHDDESADSRLHPGVQAPRSTEMRRRMRVLEAGRTMVYFMYTITA